MLFFCIKTSYILYNSFWICMIILLSNLVVSNFSIVSPSLIYSVKLFTVLLCSNFSLKFWSLIVVFGLIIPDNLNIQVFQSNISDPFQLQYNHHLFQSQVISLFRLQHNVKLFQSKMIYPFGLLCNVWLLVAVGC